MQLQPLNHEQLPLLPEISMSWRGRLLLLLCSLIAALGLFQQSWLFLVVGLTGWLVVLLLLLQFRVDIRDGLDNIGVHGDFRTSESTHRAGHHSEVTFALTGTRFALLARATELHHSAYIQSDWKASNTSIQMMPSRPFFLKIPIQTPVAGKFMLFGVKLLLEDSWALFRTHRYIHCPAPIRVLPSIPLGRAQRQGKRIQILSHSQRGAPQRRVGTGSELHDIRDYQPGDQRRLIVWKHSLRHRKLMCREFESESPLTTYILFDIGQSMREGQLGQRKLDYASEVACAFAHSAIEQRDRVGLISFDGKIHHHLKAAPGPRQFQGILRQLGDYHKIVDREFAHITLSSLCSLVGQFLWREGLLAGRHGRIAPTPRQTVEFVWDYIQRHPDLKLPKSWESDQELVDAVLRIFCKHVGIELPYRYHQWVTYKAAGLRQSIEEATLRMHGGQLIVVLSDLGDILHWDGIYRALQNARNHRHHIIFLSPFSPWFLDSPTNESSEQAILRELLTLEQWTWRKRVQRLVGPLGIPVLSLDAATAPSVLLDRLQRLRLGGRL